MVIFFNLNSAFNSVNLKFLVYLFSLTFFLDAPAQSNPHFPLKLIRSGRHLVDQKNIPFLIKEFSAWGMIQALSETDEMAMMDSLKKTGFNTLLVSIISNAVDQMGGNPPYWKGISPFNVKWDFSTPNEKYFQHADRFLAMALSKGFFVMLVPCYLGYFDAPGQGWWDEVRSTNNSPEKMRKFGEFLGDRYKNNPNIMWIIGGDNDAKGIDSAYMNNLVEGIKLYDQNHLWSGHFSTGWSTDNELYKRYIDIDGLYVWKEISLGKGNPQYLSELNQYQKGKMIIQLDQSYEHDVPHYADNENPQWIRRKMWDGLLSGCAGTSFSSGTLNNQAYWMKKWKPLMNTPGMQYVNHCFSFFGSIPWHNLIPDTTTKVISDGRGVKGSMDYICAAKSPEGDWYVMYIPTGRTLYVNVKEMSGNAMRMHWYNPRFGSFIQIGHVGGNDTQFGLVTPDDNDWVLVFDNFPSWKGN